MKKFVIGIIIFTFFILTGSVYIFAKAPTKANLTIESQTKIEIDHEQFSFGTVSLSSGVVEHRFPIKNSGTKDLRIANLASSCACTKVYFQSNTQTSPKSGMKGMTKITDWVGIIKPGESGEMVMEFYPNFHGPTGIGKIVRSLSFETNDLKNPYVILNITGEVVR